MTKILDWSSSDYLTAAIESSIHLWSGRTQSVKYTINATSGANGESEDPRTVNCLKWDKRGEKLGYSFTVEPLVIAIRGGSADDDVTMTDDATGTNVSVRQVREDDAPGNATVDAPQHQIDNGSDISFTNDQHRSFNNGTSPGTDATLKMSLKKNSSYIKVTIQRYWGRIKNNAFV